MIKQTLKAAILAASLTTSLGAVAAGNVTDNYFYYIATGAVDMDTDTFWCTLHTSSLSFSKAWAFASSLTNELSTGGGYTAGGHACTITVSVDTTNHRMDINTASHNWTSFTGTARYECMHKHRGSTMSANELVGCFDFGSDITATAGTFTVPAASPAIRQSN